MLTNKRFNGFGEDNIIVLPTWETMVLPDYTDTLPYPIPDGDYYDPVLNQVVLSDGTKYIPLSVTPSISSLNPTDKIQEVEMIQTIQDIETVQDIEVLLTAGFDVGSSWPIMAILGIGFLMMFKKAPGKRQIRRKKRSRK